MTWVEHLLTSQMACVRVGSGLGWSGVEEGGLPPPWRPERSSSRGKRALVVVVVVVWLWFWCALDAAISERLL